MGQIAVCKSCKEVKVPRNKVYCKDCVEDLSKKYNWACELDNG